MSSGILPPGLFLESNTGSVEGDPELAGVYPFIIQVTDADGCTGLGPVIIISCPSITITVPAFPAGQKGVFYGPTTAPTVSGTNIPPLTFGTIGALPPGLAINTTTGQISGVPTTVGVYSFYITVTDLVGCTGITTTESTITISCPNLTITPPSPPYPPGFIGVNYATTAALVVTGGTAPYTFTLASGTLPPGLLLVANSGVIQGVPTTAGIYPFIIQVTDLVGCTGFLEASILISCPNISISVPAFPAGQKGVFYGPDNGTNRWRNLRTTFNFWRGWSPSSRISHRPRYGSDFGSTHNCRRLQFLYYRDRPSGL